MPPPDRAAGALALALLAAGGSTRFGGADKLMAPLGDRPLIGWAARAGLSAGAAHRFLVAGPDAGPSDAAPGYERLVNPHPERGLSGSLRIAAAAAREKGAHALVVLLADMPFVSADHLARIVAAFRADAARPVFSVAPGGAPQPPALFPARLLDVLQALEGDRGARALARDARLVEAPAGQLVDIDTPDDLDRARVLLAAPGTPA